MKKKGFWGVLSALACALVLVLAGVTPALAADAAAPTGTITVTSEVKSESKLYQVITVSDWTTGSTNAPTFTWNANVATWLRSYTVDGKQPYAKYVGAAASGATPADDRVTDAFGSATTDEVKALYQALAASIGTGAGQVNLSADHTLDFTTAGNDGTQSLKWADAPMGSYLVLTSNTDTNTDGSAKTDNIRIYSPSVVNLVPVKQENGSYTLSQDPSDYSVVTKSTKPTISKSQDTTDLTVGGLVGQTVTYTLIADVPTYAEGYGFKNFSITDTMSKGLTYTNDSAKFYTVDANGKPTTTELENGALALAQNSPTTDPTTKATTIKFNGTWASLSKYAGQKVAVVYKATINSDAVVHNALTNDATLNYGNNFTTNSEQTKLYTYGISVLKYELKGGTKSALKGAKFELQYSDKDGKDQQVSFTGSKGSYAVAAAGAADSVTEVEVSDDGKLLLSNLAEGTYRLVETKAPDGYQKLQQPIEVTITKNGENGNVNNQETDANNQAVNPGFAYVSVENKAGFSLPQTGGTGTLLLTAAGVVLLGGAALLVLRKSRQ